MRHFASESSRTTHATAECCDACEVFTEFLYRSLSGLTKEEILFNVAPRATTSKILSIAKGDYRNKPPEKIKGTGYVVDSLEAALFCFWNTDSFKEAVLMAANLGDDADTTAAICGQIAGTYYGVREIPEEWRTRLAMSEKITNLGIALKRV